MLCSHLTDLMDVIANLRQLIGKKIWIPMCQLLTSRVKITIRFWYYLRFTFLSHHVPATPSRLSFPERPPCSPRTF